MSDGVLSHIERQTLRKLNKSYLEEAKSCLNVRKEPVEAKKKLHELAENMYYNI